MQIRKKVMTMLQYMHTKQTISVEGTIMKRTMQHLLRFAIEQGYSTARQHCLIKLRLWPITRAV